MRVLVSQIVDFCESYQVLERCGVTFKGLAIIDMAANFHLMQPIYKKYTKKAEMPLQISKYRQKLNELKLIHQIKVKDGVLPPQGIVIADGEAYVKDTRALEVEYKEAIDVYQNNLFEQREMMDDREENYRELNLTPIDRNSIIFKEDNPYTARILGAFAFLFK